MLRVNPPSAALDATPALLGGAAARGLAERQLDQLTRLAEIGMDVAEAVGREARAEVEGAAADGEARGGGLSGGGLFGGDLGLAFSRVSRAVRLTIALQSRIVKDLQGLDRAEGQARKRRIHRLVERAIEAEHADEDDIERLSDEAWERLTEDEDWDEVAGLPFDEAVARVCGELGISPPLLSPSMGERSGVGVRSTGGYPGNTGGGASRGFPANVAGSTPIPTLPPSREKGFEGADEGCERRVWPTNPPPSPLIPAEAGTQDLAGALSWIGLGPRLRGDERMEGGWRRDVRSRADTPHPASSRPPSPARGEG